MKIPKTMLLTVAALYSLAAVGSAYARELGTKPLTPLVSLMYLV